MTELKDILVYIRKACMDVSINPTHDMQLDCATRIYNSQSFKVKEPVETPKEKEDMPKASDKQIAYLVQLGYEGDVDSLNLQEAKELIRELKEKKRLRND